MLRLWRAFLFASLAVSCSRGDSDASDRARRDLTKAQTVVTEKRHDIVAGTDDVERRTRELASARQELSAKETTLATNRRELGSAQATVVQARDTFVAIVTARLAKLDVALARLASATDTASADLSVGLRARRDRLAARIAAMPDAAADTWAGYTQDIDTTFDAIERDLHAQR